MTDFGRRPGTLFATQDKQDDVLTALALLHTDVATTILALIDGVETSLAFLEADLGALTARTTLTFVNNITFDNVTTTYAANGVDVSAYRRFALLIEVVVVDTPTDVVIRVQFSDDDSLYYNYMNGPFGDIRYEDAAGTKTEAISGECVADYMRVEVVATGTNGTHKFVLTVKAMLDR